MQKKMMILGASALQIPAIKKAKELGFQIILVDYDENAPGFPLADVKLVVSTLDQEEVYRQALIYQPDVVITSTSDGPVRTAAYVNEKLGKKPDLSYGDSLCATIKSHMRDRLKENGVPIPAYYAIHDFGELKKAVSELNGYCIVKPADNAGSRGVVLVDFRDCSGQAADSEKEAVGLIKIDDEKLREIYEYSKSNSRNGIVMAEEFMTGAEVSVESMTVNGETTIVTITDKFITPPPYFVELGHSQPSILPGEVKEAIRKVTLQAVKAIRLQNGPSHTEIKVTESGPKIVEIAARLGGDFITSKLVPLSTGVDMVGSSVLLAAGEKTDLSARWEKGSAIRFIPGIPGRIRSIAVEEDIHALEGLEEFVLYKKAGDEINGTKSSNDRLGHVIASGKTAGEALDIAGKALEFIHIDMEKE
ncbi:biotin carboxylase [Kineothrix alysoides]|uniref:Biotin carboxylase n=1 Tax=Kineothrix alysoides TaxID=1469948 RepID=A0A4R1R249_9FIRM|nr:ATP-grasp domain-containing protein [Kineothrix alysoides]TCL59443.1 biotin carboxylase [Kineothrix alysoides]